ncbi:MAG TPA: proteasome activator [Actinomycetota bacterium]
MDEEQRTPDVIVPGMTKDEDDSQEIVEHPAKLLRIASMIRELLEEARHSSLDEGGRKRLQEIYDRALVELKDVLTEDLRRELDALAIPFTDTPSESEIRVAQAQLVGWLEGLFHGIQAALWAQQMQARQQLEEMRRRGLPSGLPGQPQQGQSPPGQYL